MSTKTPDGDSTPLMKQYNALKAKAGDALLLFRMGDFYELFGDDAVLAAKILEITLTSRDKNKPNPMPMAGVPHHSVQSYLQKLLKAGYKVAIGEQMEDPSQVQGKAIVRRDVTRIFTPGVQFDAEGAEACYLAAWVKGAYAETSHIACLDVSTGETLLSGPLSEDDAQAELTSLPVKHLLRLGESLPLLPAQPGLLQETLAENYLSHEQAQKILKDQYAIGDLTLLAPNATEDQRPHALRALAIAAAYALKTQGQGKLDHLRIPSPLRKPHALAIGPRTAQHLDLIPESPGQSTPTLFALINKTRSALGARALRRSLLAPLRDTQAIRARQEAVRELASDPSRAQKLQSALGEVYDLERICGRLNARLANPRDTLAMGRSLAALSSTVTLLGKPKAEPLKELATDLTKASATLSPLGEKITRHQREDAPLVAREGGIFNSGVDPELDRLLELTASGERWLLELEAKERSETGIPNLKIRYNRVFGYYIEVTQAHLKNVPDRYRRKQTTAGAERFFTEELKKFEDEILTAGARQKAFEQGLFERLLEELREKTVAIMSAARALGELESLLSLADLSAEPGWTFPEIDDSLALEIRAGRHPMVDAASNGSFVPNDLALETPILVITGPNMGGKSTVMRQTALIVLLGQMGAPVPAAQARWGVFSSLYTRIGAHDAIARGQSTFMVEMSELAHILHHADERSLIVLDEIGRGTSTYDGISVAWATLEWICNRLRSRTLFATHYHELTALASELQGLRNAHMAVERGTGRAGAQLRFLYQLREGPASESFGIHVARIAGLPKPVVDRAWTVLERLEREHQLGNGSSPDQLSLFAQPAAEPEKPAEEPVPQALTRDLEPLLNSLEALDLDQLTPLQALNELARLKRELPSARA